MIYRWLIPLCLLLCWATLRGESSRALPDAPYAQKLAFIQSQGQPGNAEVVSLLIPLLDDPVHDYALAALHALGEIGTPAAAEEILRRTEQPDFRYPTPRDHAMLRAAQLLIRSGHLAEATPLVDWLLESPITHAPVQKGALLLKVQLVAHPMSWILEEVRESKGDTRQMVIQLSAQVDTGLGLGAQLLQQSTLTDREQIQVLTIAAYKRDPSILPVLSQILGAEPSVLTDVAIWAAGEFGEVEHVDPLLVLATSDESSRQKAARAALVRMNNPAVDAFLRNRLAEPVAGQVVQAEVIRALGGRADPAAVEPLLALGRESGIIGREARRALGYVAPLTELGQVVEHWLSTEDSSDASDWQRTAYRIILRQADPGPALEILESHRMAAGSEESRGRLNGLMARVVEGGTPTADS